MVKVKYVGRKAEAVDMWYGSGEVWFGAGDVRAVNEEAARRLIAHPDEFELANPADAKRVADAGKVRSGSGVFDVDTLSATPIERMSKEELIAFARIKYDVALSPAKPRKVLIDEVAALVKGGNERPAQVPLGAPDEPTPEAPAPTAE